MPVTMVINLWSDIQWVRFKYCLVLQLKVALQSRTPLRI